MPNNDPSDKLEPINVSLVVGARALGISRSKMLQLIYAGEIVSFKVSAGLCR